MCEIFNIFSEINNVEITNSLQWKNEKNQTGAGRNSASERSETSYNTDN